MVISLGDAALAQADWKPVAAAVSAQLYGQPLLLPPELSARGKEWVDSITRRVMRENRWLPLRAPVADPQAQSLDEVLIEEVSHGQSAVLGPVLVAWHAWEALAMPRALSDMGFNPTQQALATVTVINRMVEPLSEHALAGWVGGDGIAGVVGGRDSQRRLQPLLLRQ